MRRLAVFLTLALAGSSVLGIALLTGSASAQPIYSAPPKGFTMVITDSKLDFARLSDSVLHIRFVNGGTNTLSIPSGIMSLQLVGPAPGRGVTGECVFGSDGLPRSREKPILLKAGASYEISIPMSTAVCTDNSNYHDRTDEVRIRSILFLGGLGTQYSSGTAVDSNWIQATGTIGDADHIRMMLQKSVDDWNRHDINAFATCYKKSPDILFIGRKVSRGYDQMVATYKAAYSTPEKMGTLSFTGLETQPLDANFATVTGHFHLERTVAGGGNADGYFLLVVEHTPDGWKIVRDDSTSLPPTASKP